MIDGRNQPYDDGRGHERRRRSAPGHGYSTGQDAQGGAEPDGYGYEPPGYSEPGYDAYPPTSYGDDSGYAPSFIERGFDDEPAPRQRGGARGRRKPPTETTNSRAAPAHATDPRAVPGPGPAADYPTGSWGHDDGRGGRGETGFQRGIPETGGFASPRVQPDPRVQPPDPRAQPDPRVQPDPRGPESRGNAQRDGYDTGLHDRYDGGHRDGYADPRFAPSGYDTAGYPIPGRGDAGHAGPGYDDAGYSAGYPGPGHDDRGYADQAHSDLGYANRGRADRGYGDRSHADRGYDDRTHGDRGHGDPGYAGDNGYRDSGYRDSGYRDPGHGASGYGDPGYGEPGYGDRGYSDRVYGQPARDRGRFGDADDRGDDTGRGLGDGEADGEGPRRPRRKRRGVLTLVLVLIVGFVGAVGLVGFRVYETRFATPDYSGSGSGTVQATVNPGDTATLIGASLTKLGVIKSEKAFFKAAASNPDSVKIQPGSYNLHKRMSAANALDMLLAKNSDGSLANLVSNGITITEGMISVDIFEKLHEKTGVPVADFVAAAKDPESLGVPSSWYTRDDGKKSIISIEGFLFPDTYTFQPGETAKQMLSTMVKEFMDAAGSSQLNIEAGAKTLGMTPYEVLITASIAQEEAASQPDMAGVAEVVYNRIYRPDGGDSGAKLEIDSEVNYWLRITGHSAQDSENLTMSQLTSTQDPYSTHLNPGLPPGAIGNPGKDALSAALHPDTSKRPYYYWQTLPGSPKVVYAKTGQEACQQRNESC
ncbi:hypothetical protein GCM10023322_58120 [Rugosimonospora acidiphila]|uniref:Endolytic murein transglycosylase n=1 Tax=Rugosimonospora acidiphila TaxID=556531 RepID=A0ABP9SCL7_9ACTN